MTLPALCPMSSPRTGLQIECIDRMYLNVYVPQLQYAKGIVGFVHPSGVADGSTAPGSGKRTDAFTAAITARPRAGRAVGGGLVKGQRKDEVMHEHLAVFPEAGHTRGCCRGASAGEDVLFRTEKRRDADGRSYPITPVWSTTSTATPSTRTSARSS